MGQGSRTFNKYSDKVPPGNRDEAADSSMALGSIKEDLPEEVTSWALKSQQGFDRWKG